MKHKVFILFALILLMPMIALADVHTVENQNLILTVDDTNLHITVTDKATGKSFVSNEVPSGKPRAWKAFVASPLVLDVVDGEAVITKQQAVAANDVSIQCTEVDGGIDAEVDFTALGIRIRLCLRLDEDSLAVTLPADGLTEYPVSKGVNKDGVEEFTDSRVCSVYLLPCFGATKLDEKAGYIFVPEAAGAIIDFSAGENMGNTPYSKRLYGGNIGVDTEVVTELNQPAEMITLPVYGLAHTDDRLAYLAVVEEGAASAKIMAYPAGVITDYNWVSAQFVLREQYIAQTTRTEGLSTRESKPYMRDMTVRFYILTGEDASYAGMARRYQKVLQDCGSLQASETAYRPRFDFLGAESAIFLLWNSVEKMTSVKQMADIVAAFEENGIEAPLVVYRGWQPGGLSWSLGSGSVQLESGLGKKNELIAFAESLRESGGQFFLELDPVQANTGRTYNARVDLVRTLGQTIAQVPTGAKLYRTMHYLTPSRSGEIVAAVAEEWSGHVDGLAVKTLPHTLYSYYSQGVNHTRGDTLEAYSQMLTQTKTQLALENPLAAYFGQMDVYLDMPLDTTSYSFVSAEVPFLPMVLSGNVPYYSTWLNFESNRQKALLKLVEYGAYPSWLITAEKVQPLNNTNSADVFAAQWRVMLPQITTVNAELETIHAAVTGASMVDHERIAEDVVRVTYDNGVRITINYRKKPFDADGVSVPALSFILEGGEGA